MLPQKNVDQEDPENPWKCLRKFPSRKDLKYIHHSMHLVNFGQQLQDGTGISNQDIVKPT